MKKLFAIFAFILSAVAPLGAAGQTATTASAGPGEDALRAQIDAKTQALQDVNKQLIQTQSSLNDTVVKGKTLKQEIGKIDATVQQANLGIQKSQLTIDKLGLEIESIGQNISDTIGQLASKHDEMVQLIKTVQQNDNQSTLLTFLSTKSLSDGILEMQTISDLNGEILTEMSQIRQLKSDLEDQQTQTSQKKAAVQQQSETLKAQKAIAQDQLNQRQQLLSSVKNDEQKYRQMVSDLERQQQAISDEISGVETQLRETYHVTGLPTKRPGVFAYPIANPVETQAYGNTAFAARAYKTQFHNGLDFAATIGTPIYAADDGVVTLAGNNGRLQYGKFVFLKHANGLSTIYGHMSRQAVVTGDTVKRGDLIGYSGNTGYATGPHLHFGVYVTASVQMKNIPGAGIVPVGYTLNPADYL